MFHKALWMWNWKRGKYAVLIMFLVSMYVFPYKYYKASQTQMDFFYKYNPTGEFYYDYYFSDYNSIIILSIIALACLMIGWERSNLKLSDSLMVMPFKRSTIFFSKWLFGIIHIVTCLLLCWALMYLVYRTTIHFEFQSFNFFHRYFFYAIITYIALYTTALCIGTFTGSIISQGTFCALYLIKGFGILSLLFSFYNAHLNMDTEDSSNKYEAIFHLNQQTEILAPIKNFHIRYNYDMRNQPTKKEGPVFYDYSSPKILLVPILYTICSLLLGIILYKHSPNENNKKVFSFQTKQKLWIVGTTFYFALIGGSMLHNSDLIFSYYFGLILFGTLSYFALSRLTNYKVL
ncbi:hypothetical protein [Bacillus nitratireducens]|uniref:ABC transporter permease n=1 Tax=Bacillus nitratireducens TaxID=2026193 RepID=A0ABU6PA29_9BACI|nr:hypothetical protein [Bacillus nitratireducens]EJS59414.1 hypothetical protein ICG_01454 [Bacillus cereus BAG1X1-3]EOO72436.1 hypothetical protein IC7_03397 [Bacillus cereus BAG1O-1]PEX52024.1 acetoin ABC transporter permease [Bacillus cereus]MDR4169439.1 ABC transporter permease [Bacillus nitratireducens]MED4678157.1 ABC transporter permease [Bacillus nitratireducens]